MGDLINIQKQIKDNTEDLHNFVRDLKLWEEEMKRKDRQLSTEPNEEILPPVRKPKVSKKSDANKKNVETLDKKNKRIPGYDYKSWDKFDVEKACEEVDSDNKTDSEDENVEEAAKEEKYLKEMALYEKELGNRHVKAGKWDEAIAAYTKAISSYPRDPIFFANRALCYLKKAKYEEVESDCTAALKLDPTYVKALMRRAAAREALGRLEDARYDLRQTLQLEPNNVQAHKDLTRIQAIKNDKKNKGKTEIVDNHNKLQLNSKTPSKPLVSKQEICQQTGAVTKCEPDLIKDDHEPPWKPCGNTVLPVSKPPHLRSQKCLKRIEIYDIGPNLAHHECKIKSENLQQTPSLAENIGDHVAIPPQIATTSTNQRSILTITTPANTLKELPSPPKNSVQFHKSWNHIKDDSNLRYSFLKQIPGESLPEIFKESLESQMFSNIVETLATQFVAAGDPLLPYLRGLSSIRRFSTIALFMNSSDKAYLSTIFNYCLTKGECSQEEIHQLCRLYEMA